MNRLIVFTYCFILFTTSWSQEVKVKGVFLEDSAKVGEHVAFSLTAKTSKSTQLLFPSKTHSFYPFELIKKQAFPTVLIDSAHTLDSAIYMLRTFEMDTGLILKLPVYKISTNGDSVKYFSNPDSLALKKIILSPPDKLEVKVTADFYPIPKKTNWPFWTIVILAFTFITGVTLLFTGKPLLRYIAALRVKKRHQQFITYMNRQLSQPSEINVDEHVQHWKNHIAYLSKKPFHSYTTKDFSKHFNQNDSLITSLKYLDGIIYGGKTNENIADASQQLIDFSNELFNQRLQQLKHGKRAK